MRSPKGGATYLLDTNIVIYLDVAGLLPACGKIAELGLARVAIPGEVKKELDVKGMPSQMQSMISEGTAAVVSSPALAEKTMRGNGEKHAIVIAQALIDGGQDVIIVTSDKRALRKIIPLGIAGLDIASFVLGLYEKQAITGDEKEQALQRLVDSGIISPRYGPSP